MATLDFSAVTQVIMTNTSFNPVGAFGGTAGTSITWNTAATLPRFSVSLLSSTGDIDSVALTGTIDTILIQREETFGLSGFATITGLNVPLESILSNADVAGTSNRLWETVLAGSSTIVMPARPVLVSNPSTPIIFGDFNIVETGTVAGAADEFIGSGVDCDVYGDAFTVAAGATLIGGNDIFTKVNFSTMTGDVRTADGALVGGNDVISLDNGAVLPLDGLGSCFGDALILRGAFDGGDDSITVLNVGGVENVVGDFFQATNSLTVRGGNDTILLGAGLATGILTKLNTANVGGQGVIGDGRTLTSVTDAAGGDDTITVRNVDSFNASIIGDFSSAFQTARLAGGNDVMLIENTSTNPSFFALISGDFGTATDSRATGGNDRITVSEVRFTLLTGDFSSTSGTNDAIGGNDTITWSILGLTPSNGTIMGDGSASSSGNFTGGNDVITFNKTINGVSTGGLLKILGDGNWSGIAGKTFRGGNDIIVANSGTSTNLELKGDLDSAAGVTGTIIAGNDRLTAAASNDQLWGDGLGFGALGGDDILDGRGGNDIIDGNGGTDTAVFSLELGVTVNLGGIAGSNSNNTADPFEAIGQGFDQLINIENVIGSSKGDSITGNAVANVLNGGGGIDTLRGLAGNDTYVVDNAADVVIESAGQGTADRVLASASYALAAGADIEVLQAFGTANVNLTGNALNNTIAGNAAANLLSGLSGNDVLSGLGGNDILTGGVGRDIMAGGVGLDDFDFNLVSETGKTAATRDIIRDFTHLQDDIDLFNIDANSRIAGNQAFSFLAAKGAAFTGVAGQLHWLQIDLAGTAADKTIIEGDINGDRLADFQIELTGLKTLTAVDFIL